MLNFKSILYKQKYYIISFKLKFILNSKLNISTISKHIIFTSDMLEVMLRLSRGRFITHNKFNLSNIEYNGYHNGEYITKYFRFNLLHRDSKPAEINKMADEFHGMLTTFKAYYKDGLLHRDNKPAVIYYFYHTIERKEYYQNGLRHRDNGPAIIDYSNGIVRLYYQHDKEIDIIDEDSDE